MDYFTDNGTGNASWNGSLEQLLLDHLGPKSSQLVSAVILTIVYSLIFLSGLIGNVCTCIVIARNNCMQTTTNYYLFSLAVSDLLLLTFGLPPELYTIWEAYPWRLGEAFCYLRQTILELTSYASVLTITAFTVERYLAICRPLLTHKIAVLSRAVKIIVVIWIVSLVAALPYAVHTRIYPAVTWPPTGQPVAESLVCSIPDKWLEGRMTYIFQISTFLFFLAPVTLIICLYILIGIAVRRSPLSRGASDEQTHAQVKHAPLPHQPRRVVIRMLVAVTVAFIICWAPFHTQRLMVLYVQKWTPELLAVQSHIFYISGVLYFVSSTVNPILYNVISRRYRVAFKETIFGPCTRFGSSGERPRFGSNTMNRNVTNCGDSNFNHYSQQHHGLLIKDSPANSLRRSQCRSLRYDVTGRSTSRKPDVIKQGPSTPRDERLPTTLCPDILNCKKAPPDGGRDGEQGELRQIEPLLSGVNAVCADNECSKHLLVGVGKCKHSSKGIVNPGRSSNFIDDVTLNDVIVSDGKSTKHATGPLTRCLLGDTVNRLIVTSHQDGVEEATVREKNASLCKQCLTHASNGNTPHNGTVAYHVRFDVTQPRTVV